MDKTPDFQKIWALPLPPSISIPISQSKMPLPVALLCSGVSKDYFQDMTELIRKATCKSVKLETGNIECAEPPKSQKIEDQVERILRSLSPFFEMLINPLEEIDLSKFRKDDNDVLKNLGLTFNKIDKRVYHKGRNILDLNANIRNGWQIQTAQVKNGLGKDIYYHPVNSAIDDPLEQIEPCEFCNFTKLSVLED